VAKYGARVAGARCEASVRGERGDGRGGVGEGGDDEGTRVARHDTLPVRVVLHTFLPRSISRSLSLKLMMVI
jgi:hypothetical protein